jgi:hypothetical protein
VSSERLKELAEKHGLEIDENHQVGNYTPSSVAATAVAAVGPIAAGHTGALALRAVPGNEEGAARALSPVVNVHLPATIARLPQLLCRDASWRFTKEFVLTADGFERLDHETVFESMAVHRRFAVEHRADADAVLLRRIFTPTFLDWLGDHAPEDLYFELQNGRLAVFLAQGDDLEILWEASARITERISGELAESTRVNEGTVSFAEPLRPPRTDDEPAKAALAGIAKVKWSEPPKDVRSAIAAYEDKAGGGPGVYGRAFLLAGGIGSAFLVIAAILLALGAIFAAATLVFGGLAAFWVLFPMAVKGPRQRRASEWGKLAFATEAARAEGWELEDPAAFHERWPNIALPGPVRRLWRGTAADGSPFRVALFNDAAGTGVRSGYEALVVERGDGPPPVPEGAECETVEGDGIVALYRSTPLETGPTLAGLQELARAAG